MTCVWPWPVPGAAGIEATREAAEALINRYRVRKEDAL